MRRRSILIVCPVLAAAAVSAWWLTVRGQESPAKIGKGTPPSAKAEAANEALKESCEKAAEALRGRLGEPDRVIVRGPFVIGGDLDEKDLDAWHRRTIAPAAEAMANAYTSVKPDEPITIMLFSTEKSYRHYARKLFADRDVSVYGYYKPSVRTMVMNIGTGGGTLVHELTHALVDFDFPEIPDWFNEGLASLHEQCRFVPDRSGIKGLVNWRLPALQKAISAGRLRPLEELIGNDDFRGRLVGINYAQARYFCMYLQEKRLLRKFYKAFREGRQDDPLGIKTVKGLFPETTWARLNGDFRRWAAELKR